MKHTPGKGLPALSPQLLVQESLNNASALGRQPDRPALSVTQEQNAFKTAIEDHYKRLLVRIPNQRYEYIARALGCGFDCKKLCTLPKHFPDLTLLPEEWAGKEVSKMEFRQFLSETTGISAATLSGSFLKERVRPSHVQIVALFDKLHLPYDVKVKDGDELAELCGLLGWRFNLTNTLEERKDRLIAMLKKKWGLSGLNAAAPYLDLSSSTMDNIKMKWDQHVSTAHKIAIALSETQEPKEIYQLFRLHPIANRFEENVYDGEEDGLVKVAISYFDSLTRKLDVQRDPGAYTTDFGCIQFFTALKETAKDCDKRYGKNLYGKLVYQKELYGDSEEEKQDDRKEKAL